MDGGEPRIWICPGFIAGPLHLRDESARADAARRRASEDAAGAAAASVPTTVAALILSGRRGSRRPWRNPMDEKAKFKIKSAERFGRTVVTFGEASGAKTLAPNDTREAQSPPPRLHPLTRSISHRPVHSTPIDTMPGNAGRGDERRVSFSDETHRDSPKAHHHTTGVSTRPERYGASVVDDRRDQVKALREISAQTEEVERISGVWHTRGLPGVTREWNDPFYVPKLIAPPSSHETLMEYKRIKARDAEFRAEELHFSKGKLPPAPALKHLPQATETEETQ